MKKIILVNKAKCLNCNQILDVTDLPSSNMLICNCHSLHLAGGKVEVNLGNSNMTYAKLLTEYGVVPEPKKHPKSNQP